MHPPDSARLHPPLRLRGPFLTLVLMLLLAVSASAGAGLVGIGHLDRSLREVAEVEAQRLVTVTHIRRLFRSDLVVTHAIDDATDAAQHEMLVAHRDKLRQERGVLLARLRSLGVIDQAPALRELELDHETSNRLGPPAAVRWEHAVSVILNATQERLTRAAADAHENGRTAKTRLLAVSGLAAALALALALIVLRRVRLASDALSESEAQFRSVVQSAPSLLAILSPEGKLTFLPPRGPSFLGTTIERMTENPLCWLEEEDRLPLRLRVTDALSGTANVVPIRLRAIRDDGSHWHASTSLMPLIDARRHVTGIILQILDVTEQYRAEQSQRELGEQLRQSQKMESVGRLAGGIAHDFNNLLTAIKGYASLALEDPNSREMPEYIEAIATAADRAAHLTSQLLTFSRKHVISPVPTDLGVLVRGIEKFLVSIVGEGVRLEIKTDAKLGPCLVDANQIEQVVLNLAINAHHAMPKGGNLLIEAKNAELDVDYTVHHPGVSPGPYVLLAVSDTGVGMSEEVQIRAFEPFFTTKPVGQGTGLGLSVVYGTVQQHGGTIDLCSEPGHGTTIRIYWPRIDAIVTPDSGVKAEPYLPRGHESILLVEDDLLVRSFAAQTLRQQGYCVFCAETALEALQLVDSTTAPPELLLTDVILPDRNGAELARELLARFPDLPVLFSSGYSDKVITETGRLPVDVDYLQKPYDASTLAVRVREAIDRAKRAGA